MDKAKFKAPYDLLSEALECKKETLDENSAIIVHPKWDSLSHVSVIVAIENEYGIQIPNDEIMKYSSVKAVIELYDKLIA